MGFLNAFSGLGRLFVAGAIACLAASVIFAGEIRAVLLTVALSLGITGIVFRVIGGRLGRVSSLDRNLVATGVRGWATVTSVRDTGVVVNASPVVEFGLDVDSPSHAPYPITIRQRVPRIMSVGSNRVVGVVVDPVDRTHLAIDWQAQQPEQPEAETPTQALSAGGVRDLDELLRTGRHATAIITSMEDAGDMSELGLVEVDAPGRDDRLFIIGLEVKQAGMGPYEVRVGHRVPERLLGRVGPRTTVDVSVDRDDDHAVAIDWSSVGH
jgi:hypothetical protein